MNVTVSYFLISYFVVIYSVYYCKLTYTMYTPIGDQWCPEGKPAVYKVIQCITLLAIRDVQKANLLYIVCTVYTSTGDDRFLKEENAVYKLM